MASVAVSVQASAGVAAAENKGLEDARRRISSPPPPKLRRYQLSPQPAFLAYQGEYHEVLARHSDHDNSTHGHTATPFDHARESQPTPCRRPPGPSRSMISRPFWRRPCTPSPFLRDTSCPLGRLRCSRSFLYRPRTQERPICSRIWYELAPKFTSLTVRMTSIISVAGPRKSLPSHTLSSATIFVAVKRRRSVFSPQIFDRTFAGPIIRSKWGMVNVAGGRKPSLARNLRSARDSGRAEIPVVSAILPPVARLRRDRFSTHSPVSIQEPRAGAP